MCIEFQEGRSIESAMSYNKKYIIGEARTDEKLKRPCEYHYVTNPTIALKRGKTRCEV